MWGELAYAVQHADGYVLAVVILGFLATVIFFERFIMLQFVYNIDFSKFLGNLKKMVAAEDLDRAISLCKNISPTSLPRIALRALEAAETDPTTIRGTIEEETVDFLPNLERRLTIMPAFAMLILMVGILGTIDSLWSAFQAVDVLDTAKKQASLSQGISTSLNTTAMGLIFGMFLLAGHQLLKGIAITLTERLHYGVTVLHNLLVPPEVAAYMPMPAGGMVDSTPAPVAAMPEDTFDKPGNDSFDTDTGADTGDAGDDSFDDVSVEDIKDEEEII